jgi:hypothetical protein
LLIAIGDLDYNYLLTFFINMEEIGIFLSCEGEAMQRQLMGPCCGSSM